MNEACRQRIAFGKEVCHYGVAVGHEGMQKVIVKLVSLSCLLDMHHDRHQTLVAEQMVLS
jgi:hypothetical protein